MIVEKITDFEKAKDFWKKQLVENFEVIKLPQDYYKKDNYNKSVKKFSFPNKINKKIINISQGQDLSDFVILYSIIQIFIYKITGISDLILSTPYYKILNIENNDFIFLRGKINPNMSFKNLLMYYKNIIENSFKFQFYNIQSIYSSFSLKRIDNLYKVFFLYENINNVELLNEINFKKTDIVFYFKKNSNEFECLLYYDKNIFEDKSINTFIKCIYNILKNSLSDLNRNIKDIEIVDDEEKKFIMNLNKKDVFLSEEKSIIEIFVEQVKRFPNKIAVCAPLDFEANEYKKLTYDDLNRKSNKLAYLLKQSGIKANQIVGIYSDYTINMIICILGVLKSGAAYLPLDPNYPINRLNYFLKDSQAKLLIIENDVPDELDFNGIIIKLNEIENIDVIEVPLEANKNNDLIYMIYTSGSTGESKGVMIEHFSIKNFINWRINEYNFMPDDITLQLVSFSFDGFGTNFYSSLFSGGTLVLPNKDLKNNFLHIKNIINKCSVTNLSVVPIIYYSILELSEIGDLPSLRFVVLAGEKTGKNIIKLNKKINKNILLINEYGPTENAITTTFYKGMEEANPNLIGKSINNVFLYVLNKDLNVLPIGIPGELFISGYGLSRGYNNCANNEKENFTENPFKKNEIMYKTGDFVKYHEDGNIEYIGRFDEQVKIRGNRLEIQEIIKILSSYEEIDEYDLIVNESKNNQKELYLYVTSKKELLPNDVRDYLKKFLPEYMVPFSIKIIDKMPRNNNGKINREALLSMDSNKKSNFILPQNEIESLLVEVFKECAGLESISVEDDFIDLGCNSLHMMKILTKIFRKNYNLTIQDFFSYRTIRKLSNKIITTRNNSDLEHVLKIEEYKYIKDNKIKNYIQDIPQNILITGANGFLGMHIINDLLAYNTKLYCFVREKDIDKAKEKFIDAANFYFPNKNYLELLEKKIFIINGDLSHDKFNLSDIVYNFLGTQINCVIHSASLVKHYGDYTDFERNNVISTKNLINFSLSFNITLNYISTTSIAGTIDKEKKLKKDVFDEECFYIGQNYSDNFYVRSKFESENLIYLSQKKGLKFNIFRLGNITGRFNDGKYQININDNAFYNKLKTLKNIGFISKDLTKEYLEFSPVDICSKAIINLIQLKKTTNNIFHIYNHNLISFSDVINYFNDFNIRINIVDNDEFEYRIKEILNNKEKQKLLMNVISDIKEEHEEKIPVKVESMITQSYLKELNIFWPVIEQEYINNLCQETKNLTL